MAFRLPTVIVLFGTVFACSNFVPAAFAASLVTVAYSTPTVVLTIRIGKEIF